MTAGDRRKLEQACEDLAVIKAAIAPGGKVDNGQFVTKTSCSQTRGSGYKRIVWLLLGALVVAVVTAWTSTQFNGKLAADEIAKLRAEVVRMVLDK